MQEFLRGLKPGENGRVTLGLKPQPPEEEALSLKEIWSGFRFRSDPRRVRLTKARKRGRAAAIGRTEGEAEKPKRRTASEGPSLHG
jgi:hypothetical protein